MLEDVSVSVKENEFVVILAQGNGGRAPLLRIIAGLGDSHNRQGHPGWTGSFRTRARPGPGFQSYMLFHGKPCWATSKSAEAERGAPRRSGGKPPNTISTWSAWTVLKSTIRTSSAVV